MPMKPGETSAKAAMARMDAEKEKLCEALSDILGSLHVINAEASSIRRWIKDPNVDVEGSCKTIEEYRGKIHAKIVAVLNEVK